MSIDLNGIDPKVANQLFLDLMMYGCAFYQDGQRIDPRDVILQRKAEAEEHEART